VRWVRVTSIASCYSWSSRAGSLCIVTEHVAVAVAPVSVQLAVGVNVLVATLLVNETVPVGLMNVQANCQLQSQCNSYPG